MPLMEKIPQRFTPTNITIEKELIITKLVESRSPWMMVEPVELA